jgi:hypothetical protein
MVPARSRHALPAGRIGALRVARSAPATCRDPRRGPPLASASHAVENAYAPGAPAPIVEMTCWTEPTVVCMKSSITAAGRPQHHNPAIADEESLLFIGPQKPS